MRRGQGGRALEAMCPAARRSLRLGLCGEDLVQGPGRPGRQPGSRSVQLPSDYLFNFLVERLFHAPPGSKGWRLFSSSWQGYNGPVFLKRPAPPPPFPGCHRHVPQSPRCRIRFHSRKTASPALEPPFDIFCAHLASPARKVTGARSDFLVIWILALSFGREPAVGPQGMAACAHTGAG